MAVLKRLAVYCGSASPADPRYVESAREVGRTLAERGIGVVYGGGRTGLMGEVGFVRGEHARVLIVSDGVNDLLARLDAYEPHRSIFAMKREEL